MNKKILNNSELINLLKKGKIENVDDYKLFCKFVDGVEENDLRLNFGDGFCEIYDLHDFCGYSESDFKELTDDCVKQKIRFYAPDNYFEVSDFFDILTRTEFYYLKLVGKRMTISDLYDYVDDDTEAENEFSYIYVLANGSLTLYDEYDEETDIYNGIVCEFESETEIIGDMSDDEDIFDPDNYMLFENVYVTVTDVTEF